MAASPPTRLALGGRIVTVDDSYTVHAHGVVYIDGGQIKAVTPADPAPDGFPDPVDTKGTIYPGLIELHNHLSYNALPLYDVRKKYGNRSQWNTGDHYRKFVTGPMKVLANNVKYVLAIVRYVECKCLLGGTTSSQGIKLSSFQGIDRYYKGVVRNVEKTYDTKLPDAATHIGDVEAEQRDAFLIHLKKLTCQLLHLAEGLDKDARKTFLSLQAPNGEWAITEALTGIHCAALQKADFEVRAGKGASMVWSPLSNLLLYGDTAKVELARKAEVKIGIGPDWSPTGSKNLLGELKIARLVSDHRGGIFEPRELLAAATREAAAILKWQDQIGTLEHDKRADLLILPGGSGDAYEQLLGASEKDIELVVIDGVPRFGQTQLVQRLLGPAGDETEPITVGGGKRLLYLHQESADPDVGKLTLADARARLEDGLGNLAELAKHIDSLTGLRLLDPDMAEERGPFLVLDHEELPGFDLRTHFDDPDALRRARREQLLEAGTPLPDLLEPLTPDPLTAVDDDKIVANLKRNSNLPAYVTDKLEQLF
jgi:5-methylthioadenosine/S-adenosylhomocysteine deaminase